MIPAGYPAHSPLSISASHIWGPGGDCTGYVTMASHFPEEETDASREGTAAHELAEVCADHVRRTGSMPAPGTLPREASNGVPFTEEMWEGAEIFADSVLSVMRDTGVFKEEFVKFEEKVHAPEIHELFYGTLDWRLWAPHVRQLHVTDYKFGFDEVDVYRNNQLIGYALCVLLSIDGAGLDENIDVIFRVVQPRSFRATGPVQEWRCRASDLRSWYNWFTRNSELAFSADAELKTGSHCRNCKARVGCPAFLQSAGSFFEAASAPVPLEITPQQLGKQLAIVEEAKRRIDKLSEAYHSMGEALVRSGRDVPGWIAEARMGRAAWRDDPAQIIAMGPAFGMNLAAEPKPITPAQAKKRGLPEEVVKSLSYRPNRGVKLVPDSGKANKVFEG